MRRQPGLRTIAGCLLAVAALLALCLNSEFGPPSGGEIRHLGGAPGYGDSRVALAGSEGTDSASQRISTGGIAFDSQNGYLYVSSSPLDTSSPVGSVTAIDGATNRVMNSANAGDEPGSVAFDPANGDLYVANQITQGVSGSVTVLAAGTLNLVATISVGPTPQGVLYDPTNGNIYVCNLVAKGLDGSNSTSIISGSSNVVVGAVAIGCGENAVGQRLALDPVSGEMFIADPPSPLGDELSVIDTTSGAVGAPVSLPGSPGGVAYDPQNNVVYAADGNNVTAINASTGQMEGVIGVGHTPVALALDPANGNLFVANYDAFSSNLTVVDTATGRSVRSISVAPDSDGIAYDGRNGCMYVVNLAGNVTVINASTDSVLETISTEGPGTAAPGQNLLSNPGVEIGIVVGIVAAVGGTLWWVRRRRPPPITHPAT